MLYGHSNGWALLPVANASTNVKRDSTAEYLLWSQTWCEVTYQ